MSEYIKGIVIAATVSAVLLSALPNDKERAQTYVRYICAIVLLLVIASPLRGISSFISSARDNISAMSGATEESYEEETSHDAVISTAADNISLYIIDTLVDKYDFERDGIRVKLIINDDDPEAVSIDEIQIYTSERSEEARRRAMEYFSDELMTDVRIFGP